LPPRRYAPSNAAAPTRDDSVGPSSWSAAVLWLSFNCDQLAIQHTFKKGGDIHREAAKSAKNV